jgi:hypothetical protein
VAIRFDLSSVIPSNAKISNASLELYSFSKYGISSSLNNGAKSLYKITKTWTETSVSWNSPWSKAGGDFAATALSQSNANTINIWEKFDVTSGVKDFFTNPSTNFGFLLQIPKTSFGVKMRSSDYTDMQYRPKLTITHQPATSLSDYKQIDFDKITVSKKAEAWILHFSASRAADVMLVDMHGRIISSFRIQPSIRNYTISALMGDGVYMLRVNSNNRIFTKTIKTIH